MFSIQFDLTSELPDYLTSEIPEAESKFAKGYINFGVKRNEWFISTFYLWSVQDYEIHWREAVKRIVDGEDSSALIISVAELTPDDYVHWWPMWRFGETIKFHEQLLFLSELSEPFDPANPYVHVGEYYNEVDEDGHRVSEWEVSVSDMAAFLDA